MASKPSAVIPFGLAPVETVKEEIEERKPQPRKAARPKAPKEKQIIKETTTTPEPLETEPLNGPQLKALQSKYDLYSGTVTSLSINFFDKGVRDGIRDLAKMRGTTMRQLVEDSLRDVLKDAGLKA